MELQTVIIVILIFLVMKGAKHILWDAQELLNIQEQVSVMMCVTKFFKGRDFFKSLPLFVILYCIIFFGCITEYEVNDIDESAGILVVEGIITDDESVIVLSRSRSLTYDDTQNMSSYLVTEAKVYIECDDGTIWEAKFHPDWDWGRGHGSRYTVETGKLNPECQYRLKIESEEYEYHSEFACPINTPEIDSVFWIKRGSGQPIHIHVATHTTDSMVQYYSWSYQEDWEIRPRYERGDNGACPACGTYLDRKDIVCPNCGFVLIRRPYYCWDRKVNSEMLLGSTEKMISSRVVSQLTEMPPTDLKLEVLYRIDVRQHAISKRAYDYFMNIKKNSQQTGGLFAHVPSELRGNIKCITDPDRIVIGYVNVSSSAKKRLYISRHDDAYERDRLYCQPILIMGFSNIPSGYVSLGESTYVHVQCVDCTFGGASKYRPNDWPIED